MKVLHQRTAVTATFAHDDDGNMTNDGGSGAAGRTFVWDAENRLIEVWNKAATPKKLASYTYDYRSRRVKKQTTADAPQGATHIAYLYDGWNVIAEYDLTAGNPSASMLRQHDWGLDLSGSLQGAGGVGGLIRTKIGASFYFPCYDGNGNVTDLRISGTGDSYASWQYDPFGREIISSGLVSSHNFYRFSTKPFDRETEFCYYGYRYYNPVLGRWVSRDLIREAGGFNLMTMVGNNPVAKIDLPGLQEAVMVFGDYGDLFPPPPPPGSTPPPTGPAKPGLFDRIKRLFHPDPPVNQGWVGWNPPPCKWGRTTKLIQRVIPAPALKANPLFDNPGEPEHPDYDSSRPSGPFSPDQPDGSPHQFMDKRGGLTLGSLFEVCRACVDASGTIISIGPCKNRDHSNKARLFSDVNDLSRLPDSPPSHAMQEDLSNRGYGELHPGDWEEF